MDAGGGGGGGYAGGGGGGGTPGKPGTGGSAGSSYTGGLLAAPAPTVTTSSALQIDTATPQNGSVSFTYTVPNGPSASISNPAGGATYTRDQVVDTQFSCAEGVFGPGLSGCKDSNGASATITSGEQSTGTIDGTLNTATTGLNTYTVTATSADGLTTTTSISYTVGNNPPTATISSPASGGVYYQGESVPTSFSCSEGGGAPGLVECQDSNGVVATTSGGHGALNTSTLGERSYYVLAESKDGESDEPTITYLVVAAPTATITNPTPGTTPTFAHNSTAHLPFSCAEGTGGPGLASCDGYNETTIDTIDTSSGGSGLLDTSNTGSSVYTVVAISNDGARTSTNFTYKVADPPTATIISPAPTAGNPTYFAGTSGPTSFSCAEGTGGPGISDCSDGTTSGRTGTITGKFVTGTVVGQHSYTVTATSADGLTGTATLTYTVEPQPTLGNLSGTATITVTTDTDQGTDTDADILESAGCTSGTTPDVTGCTSLGNSGGSSCASGSSPQGTTGPTGPQGTTGPDGVSLVCSAESSGLSQSQAQAIAVAGGDAAVLATQVQIIESTALQPNKLAGVPESELMIESNMFECFVNACSAADNCFIECTNSDNSPNTSSCNGICWSAEDNAAVEPADLGRAKPPAFENASKSSKNLTALRAVALKNGIDATKNVASVLSQMRLARTRLIASLIGRNAKDAEFQTAMLAALDGELSGWLYQRNGWFATLGVVVRQQRGAKRTAAFRKVLDTALPNGLFNKALRTLTRSEVLSIVASLRAQGKISHATAAALRKAAEHGKRRAYVQAAGSTPSSTRLLLDVMSIAI